MLRVTQSESAKAAKQYFECALKVGDYYFDKQEVVGMWGGRAAEQLELQGQVKQEDFANLMDNLRPDGTPLTARTVENRRPGYDFTFDVPKSVSLLHAFGGDDRIVEAMRKAVDETMRELEQDMYARVRKYGAFEDRRTGRMVWADFIHFTTRPAPLESGTGDALLKAHEWAKKCEDWDGKLAVPDPHLHMHVYALNATYDPVEKQWKAGEFMRIKRDAGYYQAAYHTRLAAELQKLGYIIDGRGKAFEVRGVSRKLIELFSRRTKEVEETAKRLGVVAARSKAELGAKTRRRKNKSLTLSQLHQLWHTLVTRDEAKALESIVNRTKMERGIVQDSPEAAIKGVEYALRQELERVSEVSEKRLLAAALERSVGRAGIRRVNEALKVAKGVLRAEIEGEKRLTTADILAEESSLMTLVRDGRGRVPKLMQGTYKFKNPLFRDNAKGTEEQRKAICHVLQSNDWIVGVVGRAGTGKTTLLKEVSEGIRESGRKLVLCAPTAEASRSVLRGEGFAQADTVKRLLSDPGMQAGLRGNVLWVDEAGMLGNRDMLGLLEVAKQNGAARVVLAGDPTQIRSVPRGDAFRFLEQNAGLRVARLENIRRQKTPELKEVVEAISRGEIDRGMRLLNDTGAIVTDEPAKAREALALAYVERTGKRNSVLVVCPTHREGEAVTSVIRDKLREAGKISQTEVTIPRAINLSLTDAQKRNPAAYDEGLVVQFKQNAKGFARGECVRVSAIDAREGRVMVVGNDRKETALPLSDTGKFQVYRHSELKVARGDCLRITENGFAADGSYRLNNGASVVVKDFTPAGDIVAENNRVIPREFGHLNHGYVVTADAAQSKTVDSVLAAVGSDSLSATDMRRMYVTISRARSEVKIYTDDREALLQAAKRDTERRFATELVGIERSRSFVREVAHREAERLIHQQHEPTRTPKRQTERRISMKLGI